MRQNPHFPKTDTSYPNAHAIADVHQLYLNNIEKWRVQVAAAPSQAGAPKFLVLHFIRTCDECDVWQIVYDESDEIAVPRGLHLAYWKHEISRGPTPTLPLPIVQSMGHITARQLEGHYYWIIANSASNGYQLEKYGETYTLLRGNCPVLEIPPTRSCPTQWRETPEGSVEKVYTSAPPCRAEDDPSCQNVIRYPYGYQLP